MEPENGSDLLHYDTIKALVEIGAGRYTDRLNWNARLGVLDCISPEYDPNNGYCISPVYPEHFQDALCAMDEPTIVGVQFWCLRSMLEVSDILATQDEAGSISPHDLYKRGVKWYEESPGWRMLSAERRQSIETRNEEMLKFLASYPLRIPKAIWEDALPPKNLIL